MRQLNYDTCQYVIEQGSHWKQPLYSYGVEVRLSTSYPPQTLPYLCYWWDLLSMMMMMMMISLTGTKGVVLLCQCLIGAKNIHMP
ncbi:hypothetical protein HanRHA438_Chr15g0725451 [Helianthus annuus]|nr:hypothetical protein HanRHA438_Chr15g0725451 [Helianthus annuus]